MKRSTERILTTHTGSLPRLMARSGQSTCSTKPARAMASYSSFITSVSRAR